MTNITHISGFKKCGEGTFQIATKGTTLEQVIGKQCEDSGLVRQPGEAEASILPTTAPACKGPERAFSNKKRRD